MYNEPEPPVNEKEVEQQKADQEAVNQLLFCTIIKKNKESYIRFRTGQEVKVTISDIAEAINQLSLALMIEL